MRFGTGELSHPHTKYSIPIAKIPNFAIFDNPPEYPLIEKFWSSDHSSQIFFTS
jgi:hypothetical protein